MKTFCNSLVSINTASKVTDSLKKMFFGAFKNITFITCTHYSSSITVIMKLLCSLPFVLLILPFLVK